MSSKRDYVAEILQKKARLLRRAHADEQFRRRLHPVVAGFRFIKHLKTTEPLRKELLRYGPIGYVACLEGYFRIVLKDLIDSGPPYVENATGFDEIRFGITTVVAITSRKITLGEYIAHLIPLNNLADINRCFSTLLGRDFLTELKTFDVSRRPDAKPLTLLDLRPTILRDVEELFRLRHISAHELATSEPVSPRKIDSCIGAAALFYITASDYFAQLKPTIA